MVIQTVQNRKRPVEILLIDDNEADAVLAKKAFSGTSLACNLTLAESGDEALSLLRHKDASATAARPDLILLDLNLPGKSGLDVLREIKTDKNLLRIPVIVMTMSRAEKELLDCYDLHANAYIVKPLNFAKFKEFVESLSQFWFAYAVTPHE